MAQEVEPISGEWRPISEELDGWCRRWLASPIKRALFRAGNLSSVIGVLLIDGRQVVVKSRRPAERLTGCMAVQRHLAEAGFPCPVPLAGPAPLGSLSATAESYLPGGEQPGNPEQFSRRFGQALATLMMIAPPATSVPTLSPAPAWLRWDHDEPGPWPVPESTAVDLNSVSGPAWLEEAVRRVRSRLARWNGPSVVGHGDFESQNLRWHDERLHAVHDWDSVVLLPVALVAGAAAAMFPATGPRAAAASIGATWHFLDAYALHRGRRWDATEWEVCWAAGLWVLAYNTKIEIVEGRNELAARLSPDVERRLELAGA